MEITIKIGEMTSKGIQEENDNISNRDETFLPVEGELLYYREIM